MGTTSAWWQGIIEATVSMIAAAIVLVLLREHMMGEGATGEQGMVGWLGDGICCWSSVMFMFGVVSSYCC